MKPKLKLEFYPGTHIKEAAEEAQRLADMLKVQIAFDFTHSRCLAVPGGNPCALVEKYAKKSDSGIGAPVITSYLED